MQEGIANIFQIFIQKLIQIGIYNIVMIKFLFNKLTSTRNLPSRLGL